MEQVSRSGKSSHQGLRARRSPEIDFSWLTQQLDLTNGPKTVTLSQRAKAMEQILKPNIEL